MASDREDAWMLDRLVRFTGHDADSYLADVRGDLRQIDRYELPLKAYRIEAWEFLERDVLRDLIDDLHRRGIRALLYFRAFVTEGGIGTDRPEYFDEAVANGYVATTASGDPYFYLGNFNDRTAQIDFTDPAALHWWTQRIRSALRLGADGFMQDFGEQVQSGMHFDDGSTGATMHNRYPVLFHRATRQAVDGFERRHPRRRIFFYTRSGYSGTPGSSAYEGGNFAGDVTTDWSRASGLASVTTDMLNRGIGGAFGYSADIGGYFDFHTPPTSRELFLRWAQWAALTPVMRLHGSINAGTHTPWSYDEQVVRIYNRLSRLHLRARPLILRLWRRAARTGMPVARPLWLAYPNDPEAARQDQQWMLGPNVLVAPVVEEGARQRRVYFPRGCWRDHADAQAFRGPGYASVAAPLERLPWFTRCGTLPIAR
jgi:alpha-glucosidase (family GH31 glycosyl hydrolase)